MKTFGYGRKSLGGGTVLTCAGWALLYSLERPPLCFAKYFPLKKPAVRGCSGRPMGAWGGGSAEARDFAVHHVDVVGLRVLGQTGHAHNVAGNGHNHFAAGVDDDVANEEVEAFGGAVGFLVGREGVLRLGNAHGEMRHAVVFGQLDAAHGGGGKGDAP